MTWTQVLDGIRAEHEALKSESEALTGKYATTPADDLRSDHFYVDHTPHGLYQVLFRFDARKFFDLKGRCCFYALDDPFTGMLYYDTLITFLFPCPKDHFNTVHAFRIEDTERIRELQAQKRLVLVLASPPDEYRPFDYLQAFCECGKTSFVPWCPHIVSLFRDSDLKHDELTESISEIPSIRNAIRRRAEIGRETYAATEFGVMAALQDLHYRGLHDLKAFLWKLLLTEPDLGLAAIYATRRVLLNPLDVAPDMPHCREYRQAAPKGSHL